MSENNEQNQGDGATLANSAKEKKRGISKIEKPAGALRRAAVFTGNTILPTGVALAHFNPEISAQLLSSLPDSLSFLVNPWWMALFAFSPVLHKVMGTSINTLQAAAKSQNKTPTRFALQAVWATASTGSLAYLGFKLLSGATSLALPLLGTFSFPALIALTAAVFLTNPFIWKPGKTAIKKLLGKENEPWKPFKWIGTLLKKTSVFDFSREEISKSSWKKFIGKFLAQGIPVLMGLMLGGVVISTVMGAFNLMATISNPYIAFPLIVGVGTSLFIEITNAMMNSRSMKSFFEKNQKLLLGAGAAGVALFAFTNPYQIGIENAEDIKNIYEQVPVFGGLFIKHLPVIMGLAGLGAFLNIEGIKSNFNRVVQAGKTLSRETYGFIFNIPISIGQWITKVTTTALRDAGVEEFNWAKKYPIIDYVMELQRHARGRIGDVKISEFKLEESGRWKDFTKEMNEIIDEAHHDDKKYYQAWKWFSRTLTKGPRYIYRAPKKDGVEELNLHPASYTSLMLYHLLKETISHIKEDLKKNPDKIVNYAPMFAYMGSPIPLSVANGPYMVPAYNIVMGLFREENRELAIKAMRSFDAEELIKNHPEFLDAKDEYGQVRVKNQAEILSKLMKEIADDNKEIAEGALKHFKNNILNPSLSGVFAPIGESLYNLVTVGSQELDTEKQKHKAQQNFRAPSPESP